jgi:hypothetical protein
VNSIPWSKTKRSVARVDGFKRQSCWAADDHIGRMDSRDVEKGCSVVMLKEDIVEWQIREIPGLKPTS